MLQQKTGTGGGGGDIVRRQERPLEWRPEVRCVWGQGRRWTVDITGRQLGWLAGWLVVPRAALPLAGRSEGTDQQSK